MFDIGWSEFLVIGVVALIAIGPKELPGVLRAVGQWITKIRRMASEFQGQFQEAMREAEMADIQKQVSEINDAAKNLAGSFDPLSTMSFDDKPAPQAAPAAEPAQAADPAAPTQAVESADAQSAPPPAEPAPIARDGDGGAAPPLAPASGTEGGRAA